MDVGKKGEGGDGRSRKTIKWRKRLKGKKIGLRIDLKQEFDIYWGSLSLGKWCEVVAWEMENKKRKIK